MQSTQNQPYLEPGTFSLHSHRFGSKPCSSEFKELLSNSLRDHKIKAKKFLSRTNIHRHSNAETLLFLLYSSLLFTIFWTPLSFRLKIFKFWFSHNLPLGLIIKALCQLLRFCRYLSGIKRQMLRRH